MRPQNGKRGRSRGRNKGNNQLNRTLESNGPDVKIRGTASHIYEKYQTLARDANASDDRVAAENYLQHAEHYYRLMAAAQAAAGIQPQTAANGASESDGDMETETEATVVPIRKSATPSGEEDGLSAEEETTAGDDVDTRDKEASADAETDSEAEEAEAPPRKPARTRRLNGRSRRVQGEGRGARAIKSLDEEKAKAEEADEEAPSNGADEAIA